jgi:ABC-2 type transport system ATP-binding protein
MELVITNLSKSYKRDVHALDSISLTLENGIFGLLGPNGAGKSTLMQIMATLMRPTEGEIHYGDFRVGRDDHEIRKLLGYLPQSFGLYNKLTGREFLEYICLMKGIPADLRKQTVSEVLDRVNLSDKADRKIRTYSGGMKQRIGIAQALAGDPKVIIVDEPTAGLDPEERGRFRNLLEELSVGKIVLLSTHIVSDMETSCRKLAVLNQGRLLYQGTSEALLRHVEGKVWGGEVTGAVWESGDVDGACLRRRRTAFGYELRVLSESQPFRDAALVSPSLEDGYMAFVGGASHE